MKKINKRKVLKRMLYFLLSLIVILVITTFAILQMDTFGADATGKRLERMKQSKLYKDGQFQNIHLTPAMAEGYSMQKEMISFIFGAKNPKLNPKDSIPHIQTDIKSIDKAENVFIWFR